MSFLSSKLLRQAKMPQNRQGSADVVESDENIAQRQMSDEEVSCLWPMGRDAAVAARIAAIRRVCEVSSWPNSRCAGQTGHLADKKGKSTLVSIK